MNQPNILIIMSDDQGPWAMNCAGTPELRTPHLNRLAEEGTRFENFFCASPVCSPARASFLTGRIPSQHGVHDWIKHGNMDDLEGHTWHGPEERIEYLKGMTAFTDVLAANGYTCGIAGKWHLGASDVPQKSHDFWCVHSLGGSSYTDYWVFDNSDQMEHKTQYITDFFTDRAIDFLDHWLAEEARPYCGRGSERDITAGHTGLTAKIGSPRKSNAVTEEQNRTPNPPSPCGTTAGQATQRPASNIENPGSEAPEDIPSHPPLALATRTAQRSFCLSIHYTAPHAPWRQEEQPDDIWDSYTDTNFSLPVEPPHPWEGWDPTPEQRHKAIQGYYTTITAMDRAIGRILDKLDETGLSEDTLVIFLSDNGYSMGHHGITGKGNGTFPLNMFEESVKVPFIIRYPGHVPAGVVNQDLVSQYDFMPTLLDYLGFENPEVNRLPGRSFASLWRGEPLDWSSNEVFVCDEYGPNRMVRTPQWKYVHRYDGPCELYDLANDPGEKQNLVELMEYSDIRNRLRSRLDTWFDMYVDPRFDGAILPGCRGKGQLDRVGADKPAAQIFVSRQPKGCQ